MSSLLVIPYTSKGFPDQSVPNQTAVLNVSWDDLLWAALTVGRPNKGYIFKHGRSSFYEALFRLSLVRMALEQSGPTGRRLRRTNAARTLDPSEKGAINYFLGLAVSKLFAAKLLSTPWLLHLDVFRPQLDVVLKGRSRPDLVGKMPDGSWIAMECKGRLSAPDEKTKNKAKAQSQRITSIDGKSPRLHIGAVTYFKSDILHFYLEDPPGDKSIARPIQFETTAAIWAHYYAPILGLIGVNERYRIALERGDLVRIEELDLEIGVHPRILSLLERQQWQEARNVAARIADEHRSAYQMDGIQVRAGESWQVAFRE